MEYKMKGWYNMTKKIKNYINSKQDIFATYKKYKIEGPETRWENGINHHPKSLDLMKHISELDFVNGDYFCFKMGGDGDNGESLMYLMDMYFELQDKTKK